MGKRGGYMTGKHISKVARIKVVDENRFTVNSAKKIMKLLESYEEYEKIENKLYDEIENYLNETGCKCLLRRVLNEMRHIDEEQDRVTLKLNLGAREININNLASLKELEKEFPFVTSLIEENVSTMSDSMLLTDKIEKKYNTWEEKEDELLEEIREKISKKTCSCVMLEKTYNVLKGIDKNQDEIIRLIEFELRKIFNENYKSNGVLMIYDKGGAIQIREGKLKIRKNKKRSSQLKLIRQ